jgi:DNA-binding transcriptional MerR regulator
VTVLGASDWPNSPGFQPSQAFVRAAQGFKAYVLDPHGLGLPPVNLLDLFDAQTSASDQLETLGSFLEERIQTRKGTNQAVRDVLIYFVGHGGFAGPAADFYLLHRRANASSLRATGMAIDALAEVVREKARQVRRYLFLDCCFAAASFRAFQGAPDQTAITKALDAFHVQAQSRGFPQRGTVLLCSSNQKTPSQLLPDESSTMFSSALLDVLKNGDRSRSLQLSLRDIKELVEDRLARLPEQNAPRPGLYSPDQSDGDVADVPFFSNPRAKEEEQRKKEEERRRRVEEERIQQALQEAQARKVAEEERIRQLEEEARAFQRQPQSSLPPQTGSSPENQVASLTTPSPVASGGRMLQEQRSSLPLQAQPAPKSIPSAQPVRPYLNAVILGIALSLVSMLFMYLIPIWAGVDPYPTPLQVLPSLVVSLIAGLTLGKSRETRPASLLAGLIIGISVFVFMLVKYALNRTLPYAPPGAWVEMWVLTVANTVVCGPLSWLAARVRSHSHPYEQ